LSVPQAAPWIIRSGHAVRGAVGRRIAPILGRLRGIGYRARQRLSFDLSTACSKLLRGRLVSRRLLALNLVMAGVSLLFCIRIGRALVAPTPPLPSSSRPAGAAVMREPDSVRGSQAGGHYEVIATRSLFDPNRSNSTSAEVTGRTPLPVSTLALYGVAISDDARVAFVQDRTTKQMASYRTGDSLAGGRVDRIEPDRIVIIRADGPVEVLLHRPQDSPALAPSPHGQSPEEVVPPRRARGRQD
jgi:hypothetical protein